MCSISKSFGWDWLCSIIKPNQSQSINKLEFDWVWLPNIQLTRLGTFKIEVSVVLQIKHNKTISKQKKMDWFVSYYQCIYSLDLDLDMWETVHRPLFFPQIIKIKWLPLWSAILVSNVPRWQTWGFRTIGGGRQGK